MAFAPAIITAASAALSLYQGFAANEAAKDMAGALAQNTDLQLRIADRQHAMARASFNHYNRCFRGRESTLAFQAFFAATFEPEYFLANARVFLRAQRERVSVEAIGRDFRERYRYGQHASYAHRVLFAESVALVDVLNNALRYEEGRSITLQDRAWNRKSNVMEIGRTIASDTATIYGNANRQLVESNQEMSRSYAAARTAAGQAFGRAITTVGSMFAMGANAGTAAAGTVTPQQQGMISIASTIGGTLLTR